jgi:hypothetical protein
MHRFPRKSRHDPLRGEKVKLSEYFENVKGTGVLATANAQGRVDVAVYGCPHFLKEDMVAFIMADRRSHANLQSNPHAAYLFVEAGQRYAGKRLYLTKVGEETDREKIDAMRRRKALSAHSNLAEERKYLVHFQIDNVRPLVGDYNHAG